MRESIGAGSIFSIVVVFIVLFTSYLAISVNYAKAFKIKNHIVTMIENDEGYTSGGTNSTGSRINNYLTTEGYQAHGQVPCNGNYNDSGGTEFTMVGCIKGNSNGNACSGKSATAKVDCEVAIFKTSNYSNTDIDANNPTCVGSNRCCATRAYYRVITFFEINIPIIHNVTTFPVRGESKTIYPYAEVPGC